MEKLIQLRSELAVGKNRKNSFGNYKYRSQEDILEAVKPLLKKHKLYMNITDEMVMLGDRFYVKATVSVQELDGLFTVTSVGFAREPEVKKGMDASQITGTSSSYARKYALNAMFLIDDTKDADTDEHHNQTTKAPYDMETAKNKIDKCKGVEDLLPLWQKLIKGFDGTTSELAILTEHKDRRKKELKL